MKFRNFFLSELTNTNNKFSLNKNIKNNVLFMNLN